MLKKLLIFLFCLLPLISYADDDTAINGEIVAGHQVQNSGIKVKQRRTLNFVGSGITATDAGGKTVVTLDIPAVGDLTYLRLDLTNDNLITGSELNINSATFVAGDIQATGTGPDITLAVTGGDTFGWHAENHLTYLKNNTDSIYYLMADTANNLILQPFQADGRVGINLGAGTPSYNLDVKGTTNVSGNTTIGGTLGVTGATTMSSLTTTGNVSVGGNLTVTGIVPGNLDMSNNLILNIGAAGTDFTAGGGLTIATGQAFTIGTTQWSSSDKIDGTKVADADLGDIGVATGVWSVEDDSHAHTGTTLSGIDISSDTNLAGDTEIVLTGDALSIASAITRDAEWTGLDFLVGTATGTLSGEIVAGIAPGGELGGTWASPTIDDSLAVTSWTLTTPIFSGIVNTDNNWLSGDGGAEGLMIDDNGNVGIGTTGPGEKLEVNGDAKITNVTPHLEIEDSTASEDDFEIYVDNNSFYITNLDDSKILLTFNSLYEAEFPNSQRLALKTGGIIDFGGYGFRDNSGTMQFKDSTGAWTNLAGASGAPTDADYLVGTANGSLSAEIVVGATPGGELGGTWASPTVDATHSGSAHHAAVTLGAGNHASLALSTQELTLTVAKDIVAGVGLSGGEDNVLPGADADTTLTFDSTEVEATTWGAGGNASNIWTFNLSGTDWTMTAGSALATFSAGVTISGTTTVGTLAGAIDAGGATSLEVPNGANPTISVAGQVSADTSATTGSMWRFYGDASYQLPGYYSKSFVILSPVATDDYPIWVTPWAITIRRVSVQDLGGTNIVGQLTECDGEGINCAVVDSADITATANNSVDDDGTLSNPSIDALDYVGWNTTSISGVPTSVTVTFYYTVDAVN